MRGSAEIGGQTINEAQMAVLIAGPSLPVKLPAGAASCSPAAIRSMRPRYLDWNFVASSKERLARAAADWRASIAGGFQGPWFTQPPGETSWIPLPGDPQPVPGDHLPDDHDG